MITQIMKYDVAGNVATGGAEVAPSPEMAAPILAAYRSHLRRTITAPHRSRQASIPITLAAPLAIISRDFVPWRFLDAGRISAWRVTPYRRPRNPHMNGHIADSAIRPECNRRHPDPPNSGLIPLRALRYAEAERSNDVLPSGIHPAMGSIHKFQDVYSGLTAQHQVG